MARFTIKVTDNSGKTIEEMKAAMAKGLTAAGFHLQGEAADELENPPRRVDTGRLKGSIEQQVDAETLTLTVGTNVEYGGWVHDGTFRMAPNRFLSNAFERNMDQVKEYLESAGKGG